MSCRAADRAKAHRSVAWSVPASVLCLGVTLLASCSLFPNPTPAPASGSVSTALVVRPTPSPFSTQPPTWTPLPTSLPSAIPTALPPWPTAQPTPTPAAPLRPAIQVATYFFYWHDCPQHNCVPDVIYAIPPGWTQPLVGDPDSRDGLYYSSRNRYWYLQELRDMRLAGIDIVLPVCWGDYPLPWFRTAVLQGLVEANRLMDPPLRIGLFDDTSSEVAEYNDYADNSQFDGSAYNYRGMPLDLSDPAAAFFFYDRKIKPFFQTIPQEMWATHNGQPLEAGGRPLIVVYMRSAIVHLEYAGSVWTAIKESFARDFHDLNGQPITPFIILETTWFNGEALSGSPPIDDVADGRYTWGTALLGPKWNTHAGYAVSSIGAGFDDRKNVNSTDRVRQRDLSPDGETGDPGAFLEGSFARIPMTTNLLLIETWNELYEGTNVSRVAFPEIAGQFVPEDFYIGLLRRLLRGQDLWWGAEPLRPSWPSSLEQGRSYRLDFPVRNTGARTWSAEGGTYLQVSGSLFPGGYKAWPAEPVRPGETVKFTVPLVAPDGEGSYQVAWQMAGPEGPFGPQVEWTLAVEKGAVTTTLLVVVGAESVPVGEAFSLTVQLSAPAQVSSVQLQIRFDPSLLALEGVQPLPGPLRQWGVQVDNDRGQATVGMQVDSKGTVSRLLQLRLRTRVPGQGGFWLEQASVTLGDGTVLALPTLWVRLEVGSAP